MSKRVGQDVANQFRLMTSRTGDRYAHLLCRSAAQLKITNDQLMEIMMAQDFQI